MWVIQRDEVTAVDPSQEQEVTPSQVEAVPASGGVDELNAGAVPPQLERTIELFTFTHEKTEALHRFLERIMPTPAACSRATAADVAR